MKGYVDLPYINAWILTWHSLDLKLTIGLKTCSFPLFPSEILHLNLRVIIILPKNISDISQMRPVRLLTLNPLPLIMAIITLSAVSGSTRIGLFVMKTNTQCLESMFVCFRRVACLFTYSSGIAYVRKEDGQVEVI
jgi:hypothetical protein